jgi:membrane protein
LRATALAYTTLLALVPLLAVGLGISTSLLKGGGGDEAIKQFVATLVDETAPQLGLMPRDSGGPVAIVAEDIMDLPGFVTFLRNETNALGSFLWQRLPEATRARLLTVGQEHVENKHLKGDLAPELDRLIRGPLLYETSRFTNVALSTNTLAQVQEPPTGEALVELNRTLLEEALPRHLAKSAGADARQKVKGHIQSFIENINSGGLGILGALGLIVTAIMLLSTIEETFNDIWGVKRGRNWLTRAEHYTAIIFWGPLLLVCATGLSIGGQAEKLQQSLLQTLPAPIGDWAIIGMVFLAPFVISWIVFSLLYLMIPNTKVDWTAALVGGLIACALWHVNNSLNVSVASRAVNWSKIYGPLGALPVFLVGLYFSWFILLCGAQVAYTFQFRRSYLQERQTESVNQRGREFVALRMAAVIGEHFQEGKPAPTAGEIAELLGVPVRLVHQVGELLLAAGLMTRVATEEVSYLPGRPLERITVHDVLLAMRAGHGQELATLDSPSRSLVRREYERIEAAERRVATTVSLLDVVNRLPRNVEVLTAGSDGSEPAAAQPAAANSFEAPPPSVHAQAAKTTETEVQEVASAPGGAAAPSHVEASAELPRSEVSTGSFPEALEPELTGPAFVKTKAKSAPSSTEEDPAGKPAASVGGETFPL